MQVEMHFERLDATGPGDGLTGLHAVARAHDHPGPPISLRHFATRVGSGPSGERAEAWVVRRGGEIAGGHIIRYPEADNRHLALMQLMVRPCHLRRGIGRALLDHSIERARHAGRRMLVAEAPADRPGAAFAKAMGFSPVTTESRLMLDLRAADWSRLELLRAEAVRHARAYSLERWTGPTGPEMLDDMARLAEGMNDEPLGDLDIEDQRWTGERVRAQDGIRERAGLTAYTTVARHTATGEPAGFTELVVDAHEHGGWARQGSTAVMGAHRGRRLGLVLKLTTLSWLRACEPSVERVVTWNSAANPHMLAINEAMGFRELDTWNEWQLGI